MKKLLIISHQIDKLNECVSQITNLAVLLMLGLGVWNVIGRYLGVAIGHNLSSNMLIEGQWYLFDLIFLLGLGWTLQSQRHVRVDIFQSNWNKKRKAKYELLGTLLLLIPFAIGVMLLSIQPTINSWLIQEASPDPDGLARYWVKSLIPIGFLLLSLQGISEAIQSWSEIKGHTKARKANNNVGASFDRN